MSKEHKIRRFLLKSQAANLTVHERKPSGGD
jgi:hypothetical protein